MDRKTVAPIRATRLTTDQSVTNQHPNQRKHSRSKPIGFAAMMSFTILAVGCVTPWSSTNVPLPSNRTLPSSINAQNAKAPEDPASLAAPEIETDDSEAPDVDVPPTIIRGQNPNNTTPGSEGNYWRDAMPISGVNSATGGMRDSHVRPAQYAAPSYEQVPASSGTADPYGVGPVSGGYPNGYAPQNDYATGGYGQDGFASPAQSGTSYPAGGGYSSPAYAPYDGSGTATPYSTVGPNPYAPGGVINSQPSDYADLVVNLRETQTGRFMFGVGVNSDLGMTAQVVIDERNFDWRRLPRNLDDIVNGTAWRGAGQSFRIEAVPGSQVQRYLVNFTEPYLWDTPISFNLSAFLYDRRYFDWDEQRLGGRAGLGYRITPDLSLSVGLRAEQVDFHNPRVRGISQIERALGETDLFSGKVTLTHDTRDIPFSPTEGHYLEFSYEQVFGEFDYPRGGVDYRRYHLLRQRADGSGRHTLGFSFKGGISGSQTPVFENYFAGGYSTLRGFRFRHASPKELDVIVGGQLSLLGSAEYIFPITADDMLKGALFCDYGTVEEELSVDMEDFRVAVGAGLRISVPAMGPAPIAVDFAVPITRESTDRIQNFSFFVGFGR